MADNKDLFLTERISNFLSKWRLLLLAERSQYRTDAKALMCRGIEDEEAIKIKRGLQLESALFYLSKAYVPLSLFLMYKRGIFQESFSFGEVRQLLRVVVTMQLIEVSGSALFRWYTQAIVDSHTSLNNESFATKKKVIDEYLIQKNYFRTKKENKL